MALTNKVNIKFDNQFVLGEGLCWDGVDCVYWGVDIDSKFIWKASLDQTRIQQIYKLEHKVGWCFREKDTSLLITGQKNGVYCLNPITLEMVKKVDIPGLDNNFRLNDAIVDSTGAIWGGVMRESIEDGLADGFLYRIGRGGEVVIVDDGYLIPNGPAITPDERFFFHTDSLKKIIYIFDFDVKLGALTNKRIWKKFDEHQGLPDGMIFDANGNLWIAFWGDSSVRCFDFAGRLLKEIFFPAKFITNICLGGESLKTMLVTTAANIDINVKFKNEFDGKVYEVEGHGATGLPPRYPVGISEKFYG